MTAIASTFDLDPAEDAAVREAQDFASQVIAPNAEAWNLAGRVPTEAYAEAARRGLCKLIVPQALGGLGLGVRGMAAVMEALAAECLATAFSLVVHNNLAGAIARGGSEAQRAAWLPGLMRGTRIGAFLLTEPQGGSDAAAITTHATRTADGWVLEGEKAWVSNAAQAGLLSVYAQTDASQGWRGIASFLVDPETAGISRSAPYALLGGHALGTGGFRFEGCRIPELALQAAPGAAFKAAMSGIDLARVNVAAMCCGMLRRSLEAALQAAGRRSAFGQPVLGFQGIQWMLAEAATDLAAAQSLTARACAWLDTPARAAQAPLAAAHAKKFSTRVALARIADCMQVMGAPGLRTDQPLARHLAGAKIAQYLDGTTEIQNVVISRRLASQFEPQA